MADHYAVIRPANRTYRVYFADELLFETDRVLELQEHFGERSFAAVPYFTRPLPTNLDLRATNHHSTCPLKGAASYFAFRGVEDAVWTYPNPNDAVAAIADHLGFDTSKGFRVEPA